MALNDKQERFCNEYLIDLNATQAAIRSGYSEKTSYSIGQENLNKPEISAFIFQLMEARSKKVEVTQEDVLRELKNWAYSDITETLTLDAEGVKKLPIEIRRLITKFKRVKTTFEGGSTDTIELHFVSKEKAFEMINRHIGFYEKDNDQSKSEPSTTINLGVGINPNERVIT